MCQRGCFGSKNAGWSAKENPFLQFKTSKVSTQNRFREFYWCSLYVQVHSFLCLGDICVQAHFGAAAIEW